MVEGLEYNETERKARPAEAYDGSEYSPHDEGPNYDEWVNGFENREAMENFSGLFN